MKRSSKLFKALLTTHKVLGLVTGLVVFIVAITGACWVFQEEIKDWQSPDYEIVAEDRAILTATQAKDLAQAVFPDKAIHGTLYAKATDPVEVIFYQAEPEFYQSVYLHPYSGEVLHTKDHFSGFFNFVLDGHMYVWLPKTIGGQVVKWSILIFLLIIFSGLLLWLPKKWKGLKRKVTIRWKPTTRWRRKNYDLHTVVGTYIYALAFVFAFSGSIMSFPWFYYIVFKAAGGDSNPRFVIPNNNEAKLTHNIDDEELPLDRLIPKLQAEVPDAESFELHYPHADTASIYVEVSHKKGVYYNSDYRFFDQYTLAEIESPSIYAKYGNADFADKVIRMNYDIHVGAIGGLLGKIIAFLASLIVASLPVTGFLIWWGRNNKKKSKLREQLLE
ncbi:MAG: PepSY-associated TM helix domain-containing protein [Bacteroidota bacterium]